MTMSAIEQAVQANLLEHYGLKGSLKRLPGENINFLVTTSTEEKFVFKIVDEHMPEAVVAMEFALLEHARKAEFPLRLPYIQKTYKQKLETRIKIPIKGEYRCRLITFIEGTVLENCSDISMDTLQNVGWALASFDQAIADFDHPAAHRTHRWDLVRADQHLDVVRRVEGRSNRALVGWAFDQWSAVQGVLESLPHQVIHGDGNRENLLVKLPRVVGLVDFGDCCYNPRICELAIALAYLMMDQGDPDMAAQAVIRGYGQILKLSDDERSVLFPLVCGRLAVTICMATRRQSVDPANLNWFGSLAPALELLRHLHRSMEN